MKIDYLLKKGAQAVKANAPEILTVLGVVGLGATAYLAIRTGKAIDKRLSEEAPDLSVKEQAKLTWKLYIPPVAAGVATTACIVGSNHASGRRTAAAVAAYSLTEKAFTEYKSNVVKQLGVNKEQKIRDELAQEQALKSDNGTKNKEVVIVGNGEFLCQEAYTGRYFMSDMESLKRAQNTINSKAINDLGLVVTLDDLYDLIGLKYTSHSSLLGWSSDRRLELDFVSVITPDGRPCLSMEYNYVKPLFT